MIFDLQFAIYDLRFTMILLCPFRMMRIQDTICHPERSEGSGMCGGRTATLSLFALSRFSKGISPMGSLRELRDWREKGLVLFLKTNIEYFNN